ncbi:MAG: putative transrane protein [Rhodocyclaceae bacterium]|nr:putative transrane protein [Rhodocyclaceae bacterium]
METPPQFPVAPKAFDGASRTVDAGACFDWLRQGWALFAANPGVWIGCAVLTLVILFALSIVPLVGQLASQLLLPVLGAGLLQLCRRQSEGATPEIADLFIGFKENTGNLIMVGVIYAVAIFAIGVLVAVVVGGGIAGGVVKGSVMGFGLMFGGFLLGALLILVLATPVFMAVWFAPALVFFNLMTPMDAMRASFYACLKNWLPFLVYGVILIVLFFFSALLLGLGFLVLIPVLSGALYASYRDVFVAV